MIRHLLKLVWHRKRANALVAIEIFLSFLVVCIVMIGAISLWSRWTDPLGFDWHDVWTIRVDISEIGAADEDALALTLDRLIREAKAFPEVVDAAASHTPPYAFSTTEGIWRVKGRRVRVTWDTVSDGFANVMRTQLVRGRWFRPEDDALGYSPVVIDSDLAKALFDNDDPIGQKFDEDRDGRVVRVVGVVKPYRKDGELSSSGIDMAFRRASLTANHHGRTPRNIVIRVRPGTPAAFEQRLTKRLHDLAPNVSFRIRRMDGMRTTALRLRAAPLIAGAIVALFLISMVGLGLSGVLWQNVTRRTREIGLRRALGASSTNVRAQVLGEVALLTSLAVVLGLAVVLQLPLLGAFNLVSPALFGAGVVAGLIVIYAITVLCGAYPALLASRVEPAEALRYE